MPISKESVAKLASILKIDAASITDAINNEKEVALELPEGLISYTADEHNAFKTNVDNEAFSRGVSKGKEAANEMFIKDIRSSEGLEFEGKTKANLLNALKSKYSGDKNELVSKFEQEKQGLIGNFNTQIDQLKQSNESLQTSLSRKDIEFDLWKSSPENMTMQPHHAAHLFLNEVKIEQDSQGRDVYILNGQKQLDQTMNPIPRADVYKDWVVKNNYVSSPTGRGGTDSPPQRSGNGALDSFNNEMESKGIRQGSGEYNEELSKRAQSDPQFKTELLAS